jgi:Heavy metal associated domain 2
MLEYVHFVPGRLRLKNTDLRHERRAAEAEAYIGAIPGVSSAVANPAIGSITIQFDKQRLSIRHLWEMLCAQGYVSGECPTPCTVAFPSTFSPGGGRFGHTVMTAFVEAFVRTSAEALVRTLL